MLPFAKAVFNFLELLTVGYVLILVAGLFVRPWMDKQAPGFEPVWQCWKIVVVINSLILIAFAALRFLYNDRYPLTLSVMTMLLVPFAVTALCGATAGKMTRKTWMVCIATGLVLLINSLEGLDRFTAKHHLREAGTWIRQQSGGDYHRFRIWIYTNDRILDYYAGQNVYLPTWHYRGAISSHETLKDRVDLIAIHVGRGDVNGYYQYILSLLGETPDMTFANRKGDRVAIFDFRKKQS